MLSNKYQIKLLFINYHRNKIKIYLFYKNPPIKCLQLNITESPCSLPGSDVFHIAPCNMKQMYMVHIAIWYIYNFITYIPMNRTIFDQ